MNSCSGEGQNVLKAPLICLLFTAEEQSSLLHQTVTPCGLHTSAEMMKSGLPEFVILTFYSIQNANSEYCARLIPVCFTCLKLFRVTSSAMIGLLFSLPEVMDESS